MSTFARVCGQHVVNICNSHPPSDGLAQGTLQIKPKSLKNRPKIAQNRSKSLDSCYSRPLPGPIVNIFNICKVEGRVNIQHCCQHLQVNGVNIQHQHLRRSRQRLARSLARVVPECARVCQSVPKCAKVYQSMLVWLQTYSQDDPYKSYAALQGVKGL